MAQASSAQREPSMEEILASIRRIIEDSDIGRKPEEGLAGVKPANDSDPSPMPPEMASSAAVHTPTAKVESTAKVEPAKIIDVDAFRAEFRSESPAVENRRQVSLAEIQAQVMAEREAPVVIPALAEAIVEPRVVAADTGQAHTGDSNLTSLSRRWDAEVGRADAWRLGVTAPEPSKHVQASADPGSTAAETASQPGVDDNDTFDLNLSDFEDFATSDVGAKATEVEVDNPRSGLISEEAGKQIAASFGELSEAFAARSRKTLDDMAEDMLRPMLQDWLDNNLPMMVERLVREEIERVARG